MWLSSQSISTYHYSQLPSLPFGPGSFLALRRFNCCPSDDSNSSKGFSQSTSSMICTSRGSNLPPPSYKTTQRIPLIFKPYSTSTALIQDWILGIKKDGRSKFRRGAIKAPSLLQRKPMVLQNHRRPSPARFPEATRGIQPYPTFRNRLSYLQDGTPSPSLPPSPTNPRLADPPPARHPLVTRPLPLHRRI